MCVQQEPRQLQWAHPAACVIPGRRCRGVRMFRRASAAVSLTAAAARALHAGLLFAGMAVISLAGTMPAALVADSLGRKWTIVPSCLGLASALLLMAVTGMGPVSHACGLQASSRGSTTPPRQ